MRESLMNYCYGQIQGPRFSHVADSSVLVLFELDVRPHGGAPAAARFC